MTSQNPGDTQVQNEDDHERSRRLSLQGNRPPAEIEGYTVVRRLGTGAYGTVWLAREDRTGRMVAIKYYPHRRGLNWSMLHREVEKLAAVYTSRNIVRLLDVGWTAEPPYFVMEFVENGSLGSYLAAGPLSVDEAVRITREVCSALIDAHGAGVLHCDLKPDNVLLDGQLHARICDFGQARMSHEQSPALGTLYYMAPEQADMQALPDSRWDVYAVGAMMYHMITGQPPFRSDVMQKQLEAAESLSDRLEIYRSAIQTSPVPSLHRSVRGVDSRLADIIDECLAVEPQKRLPNAQAVRDLLDARDRHRSRRPLLLLGVVGPVLLMAAMVPIFVTALENNLAMTEEGLTQRALESDALSARLQAAALEDELLDRLEELELVLADEEVGSALEDVLNRPTDDVIAEMKASHILPLEDRPRWIQLLDMAQQRCTEANTRRNRSPDTSWFLTDRDGIQLWRQKYESTVGECFNWRDYFHGRNEEFDPEQVPQDIQPIQDRHVSLAFRSNATDRYMVALSVPVRDSEGEVIGVFARTAHLGELQARLGQRMQGSDADSVRRIIALADSRDWQLLDHPWLTESLLELPDQTIDEIFHQLRLDTGTIRQIESAMAQHNGQPEDIRLPVYTDPVGRLSGMPAISDPADTSDALPDPQNASGNSVKPAEPWNGTDEYQRPWIAAMSPITNMQSPWMVIVQEERATALQPIDDMARRATRHAWMAVLAALTLMAIIWSVVWRAFNRSHSTVRPVAPPPGLSGP
ncbi:MAG: protein kinase [Planctomycetaceae bacterium]